VSPSIAVVLCLIILVLVVIVSRTQGAMVAMTKNQQRLYICFIELLKATCPEQEKSVILNIEKAVKGEKTAV
jgi:hypothetical protein